MIDILNQIQGLMDARIMKRSQQGQQAPGDFMGDGYGAPLPNPANQQESFTQQAPDPMGGMYEQKGHQIYMDPEENYSNDEMETYMSQLTEDKEQKNRNKIYHSI